jgi:hypothetical protein
MIASPEQIARWKADPQPYCITRYDPTAARSRPYGKRRFASIAEALAFIAKHPTGNDRRGLMLAVDYFEAVRP